MTDTLEATYLRDASGAATHGVLRIDQLRDLAARAGVELDLEDVETDEDREDARLLDEARANDDGTRIPGDVVARLVGGEHVIKVLREWRGMDQGELARLMGTERNYISQIETGARRGVRKAAAFASALGVPMSMIKGRL